MQLNTLSPAKGSKTDKKRVGRGIGCGWGKTCGRGHKGQKSRSGGKVQLGFEGGQMPLQRRLPKVGFTSRISIKSANIRLSELAKVEGDEISLNSLKKAGLIKKNALQAKIYLSGKIAKAIKIKGIAVSKGAKAAIESAGGTVEV